MMLCLLIAGAAFFVSSCEGTDPADETDTRGENDSTQVDSLPPGAVRVGDLIFNTNWEDSVDVKF